MKPRKRPSAGRIRRFRVATRSKVRSRRFSRWGSAALAMMFTAAMIQGVRRFPARSAAETLSSWREAFSRRCAALGSARVDSIVFEGAPPFLEPRLRAALNVALPARWGLREPARWAERLKAQFPCLKTVTTARDWLRRRVVFETELERPIARVEKNGSAFFLSDTGAFFTMPDGFRADQNLPQIAGFSGDDAAARALAEFVSAASKEGVLPARLSRLEWRSTQEGWRANLADGTVLLWGDLNWTDRKLARLRQVLADAKGRFGEGVTADLRYFGDGKILVRSAVGLEAAFAGNRSALPARFAR